MEPTKYDSEILVEISLAKALKLKNRLAGRLNNINSELQQSNSALQEQSVHPSFKNFESNMQLRRTLVNAILDVKNALYKANSGIQRVLNEMSELKDEISFLRGLPTNEGVFKHGYQNTDTVYVCNLNREEVNKRIRALEAKIDSYQDSVDNYNHATKIAVNKVILDIAS